jgi:hypothetical protein
VSLGWSTVGWHSCLKESEGGRPWWQPGPRSQRGQCWAGATLGGSGYYFIYVFCWLGMEPGPLHMLGKASMWLYH